MSAQNDLKSEIRTWLKSSQIGDELKTFEIDVEGNSEIGDGYVGDIVFVRVTGKNRENVSREYDLVLKCAKRSKALREKTPVREIFENEIEIYKSILPTFQEFERSKGITEVFNYMPKCYGTFQSDDMEVIIFENLKKDDYILWDAKLPLTEKHNELVVTAYGQWHAIGAALRDQKPEVFKKSASKLQNGWKLFMVNTNFGKLFGTNIDETCETLQGIVDENKLNELKKLKKLVPSLSSDDFVGNEKYFTVITHGDCWNNNFLFQHKDKDPNTPPLNAAILDWQLSYLSSPLVDLSYHLYSTVSEDTIQKLDDILKLYYKSFSDHLKRLGSDPEKIFPFKQFQEEWEVFGVFGIFLALMFPKMAFADKKDLPDMAAAAEQGEDIAETFAIKGKAHPEQIQRLKYIVEHAINRGLVRETF